MAYQGAEGIGEGNAFEKDSVQGLDLWKGQAGKAGGTRQSLVGIL